MSSTVYQRLERIRRQSFVGRDAELTLVENVLRGDSVNCNLFFIFGVGGIGKTTLLHHLRQMGAEQGIVATYLDGRQLDPAPDVFLAALGAALDLPPDASPIEHLAAIEERQLLLIDTVERLAPLDDWLRTRFLPQLPTNILVVMAGRQRPSATWREDPGWQQLMRVLPLDNLSPVEAEAYLQRRDIPPVEHNAAIAFSHGHPLALSLVADLLSQGPAAHFDPGAERDIVATLVERLVTQAPGQLYRDALEFSALVRVVTESLLAAVLEQSEVHDVFSWLRHLSLMDVSQEGLFPHDLARDALATDLRWRDPSRYAHWHKQARIYYIEQLDQCEGEEQRRVLVNYIYLHRDNPFVRPYFEWQLSGQIYVELIQARHEEEVAALVAGHEGASSVALARYWLHRQPGQGVVFRGPGGRLRGLLMIVAVEKVDEGDEQRDPALAAAARYLRREPALRPGETASYFRFWLTRNNYQRVSATQSHIFLTMVQHYLATAGLAYTFLPCAEPQFWQPVFAYADLTREPTLDFELDDRAYGVYVHDWRRTPPMEWLSMMGDRELTTVLPEAGEGGRRVVLDEAQFATAVHAALRDLVDPLALSANPLLNSRLCQSTTEGVEKLRTLLLAAIDSLQIHPKRRKYYRALYHTYVQPAPSQEVAAELIDVPYGSFRRYLRLGIEAVTDYLWQLERHSAPGVGANRSG